MSVESEVKKVARSKWFYLGVGILLGGTILAFPVAKLVGMFKSKLAGLRGGVANAAALTQQGK